MSRNNISLENPIMGFSSYTFFPGQHWAHSWERQHEIISRFATILQDKRIFVSSPLGLLNHNPFSIDFFKRIVSYKHSQKNAGIQNPIMDNMELVSAKHLPFHNNIIGKINYTLMKSAMSMSDNNFFWATYMNPTIYEFFRRSKFKIYDLAERRSTNPHLNNRILEWERKAVKESDLVIADNHATIEDYRLLNDNIHYIPQGVNVDSFFNINDGAREYIGYIGNLHFAIDYIFLRELILKNPKEKFLIIGGILEDAARQILELPNVIHIGQLPKMELNNHLAHMKMGLIPYVVNNHTVGIYPTKLFEYLSAGVPVISLPLPEVVQYADDDYLKIIEKPIDLSNIKFSMNKAQAIVNDNTWDVRWNKYIEKIELCLR